MEQPPLGDRTSGMNREERRRYKKMTGITVKPEPERGISGADWQEDALRRL